MSLLQFLIEATATDNPSQILTPYLPVAGIVIGGIIVGIFNRYNSRKGNVETRAPDVNEIWQQERLVSLELDKERKWRRNAESFAWELTRVFRSYVARVQGGGNKELNHHERLFHDADPPTADTKVEKV